VLDLFLERMDLIIEELKRIAKALERSDNG
jgi:hypothetical protein